MCPSKFQDRKFILILTSEQTKDPTHVNPATINVQPKAVCISYI